MAKRGLVRTIFKRLGIILINAFETIGGLLKLFDLTLRQFSWLLFVTGLGLLLLWARETFFDIAPSIASQADAWTVGINMLIVAVDAMMITIEAITSILASIISGQPQFDAIPTVSAKGVQEFCETVPPACAPINSAALVLDILIRPAASPAVCPTVRYMYPTWVYDIFWPVVNAFALSYDPTPAPGNNCRCNEHCTHQIACVVRFLPRHQWSSFSLPSLPPFFFPSFHPFSLFFPFLLFPSFSLFGVPIPVSRVVCSGNECTSHPSYPHRHFLPFTLVPGAREWIPRSRDSATPLDYWPIGGFHSPATTQNSVVGSAHGSRSHLQGGRLPRR